MQGMAIYIEFKQTAHGGADLLHAWIAKLHNFFAVIANKVVVLFVSIRLFVMAGVLTELVSFYQSRFYQ
jgi:hypothetical protein